MQRVNRGHVEQACQRDSAGVVDVDDVETAAADVRKSPRGVMKVSEGAVARLTRRPRARREEGSYFATHLRLAVGVDDDVVTAVDEPFSEVRDE
jgi:hypothetical protein